MNTVCFMMQFCYHNSLFTEHEFFFYTICSWKNYLLRYSNLISPYLHLSGSELKFVSCHKYLGAHITTDLKDDSSIKYHCRSMYMAEVI